MAAIWKGIALADSSIESNVCFATNTSLFNFSHRGEYRALAEGFICFNNDFCLHLIKLARKIYYHLKKLSTYLLVLKAI